MHGDQNRGGGSSDDDDDKKKYMYVYVCTEKKEPGCGKGCVNLIHLFVWNEEIYIP